MQILELRPPPIRAADLLERCLESVLSDLPEAQRPSAAKAAALRQDAGRVLAWAEATLAGLHHPLANVAAAILYAGDMNSVRRRGRRCWRAAASERREAVLAGGGAGGGG